MRLDGNAECTDCTDFTGFPYFYLSRDPKRESEIQKQRKSEVINV
jgi:hypothetical protein